MPDRGPIHKCSVKGCPYIGHWPLGGCCPEHTNSPLTDRPGARIPTLSEAWDTDDEMRR